MITSVAIQAYLLRMRALLKEQGFDDSMPVVYDSEGAAADAWLTDALASADMKRKGTTTKDDVRAGPFQVLFWTRTSLTPVVRQRYRLLDTVPGSSALQGKSTVSASFTIACVFVSNKAECVEDLEEAFLSVFQNTYNMPLSLEYIYNSPAAHVTPINFTMIQNAGEANLVDYKEGNLFSYGWSATIYMNYVSEFAFSKVYPVDLVVVDLYNPKGIPLASLDAAGHARTHTYTASTGEVVENVPDVPFSILETKEPHSFCEYSIIAPMENDVTPPITDGDAISSVIENIGAKEISTKRTPTQIMAAAPISLWHAEGDTEEDAIVKGADVLADAIYTATGKHYVVTPCPTK